MPDVQLRGDYITLAQAVKNVGAADTGGQAKIRIREGEFTVNDAPETRPGRKLVAGDRFSDGETTWTIVR